ELRTGDIRDLTPFEQTQCQVVEQNPNFPNEILVTLNQRNKALHDVYRLFLDSKKLELEAENPGDVVGWLADSKMKVRACQAMNAQGEILLRTRAKADDEWKTFITWENEDSMSSVISFTENGKGLYLVDSRNANTLRLVEVNMETQDIKTIAEDVRYDIGGVVQHRMKNDIQAVQILKERVHWTVLDEAIRADFEKAMAVHDGDFSLISRDQKDRIWLIGFNTDSGSIPYYMFNRETQEVHFLFSNRPALEKYKLAPMKPISFKARDGLVIEGYITLPVNTDPKTVPLILNVHGGPWVRDTWGYHPEAQWMASNGYACMQVNYRGSTGYGKDFVNAGNREWSRKMHDDLVDAVEWAKEEGYYDGIRCA
ncbi:MAG: S9 family peptidase, partial [Simkania sp.]|nr:S9 family peptidase [Simkania sp.]